MAHQSTPRFDLYAELGVDPQADAGTIEAAYQALVEHRDPEVARTASGRRMARLGVAREWLTDPERRSRYDASRARSAARSAARTRSSGREATATAAIGPAAIPWPAVDLERPATDLERPVTILEDRPSLSRRLPRALVALVVLALIAGAAAFAISMRPPSTGVAGSPTPSPEPAQTSLETPTAPPVPTIEPTAPATPIAIDPAALQQAAWDTIRALGAAAAAGDVSTAQAMLGDTAPGLRASGLRRATFPDVDPADISVTHSGDTYVAVAGGDRLTSIDGSTWTFDYADRPLAAYRSPSGEPVHDLWWSEADGRHHVYLRVALAAVSRSGVTVELAWSFDPSRPDDATYFRRAELLIGSVAFDGTPIAVTAAALPMRGVTILTSTATFAGVGIAAVPSRLGIGVTIAIRSPDGSSDRANETTFELQVR